ncbi:hypothetical protein jhhlp_001100 [Lomentospora prolificans]|uniref:Uncharacterized protein n=1 Tax=Lomentospora prolificans TaxID=41688 RepID=A0A2N3NHC1_9PEZI|nr:hypothetical protein jhhlp_001100 [Lomentospora prolificans]
MSRDSLALTKDNFAREISAMRAKMLQLRQEELGILTTKIAKNSNRASLVGIHQMEFELFKSRLRCVEEGAKTKLTPGPRYPTTKYTEDLDVYDDEEDAADVTRAIVTSSATSRRTRNSTAREQPDEDDIPSKRLAFSSDFSGAQAPDYSAPSSWLTSPLENGSGGRSERKPRDRPRRSLVAD